jgi:hypothetical protein
MDPFGPGGDQPFPGPDDKGIPRFHLVKPAYRLSGFSMENHRKAPVQDGLGIRCLKSPPGQFQPPAQIGDTIL